MSILCGLKVRHYANRLIDPNEYLDLFPGSKLTEIIGMTELNSFFLIACPIFGGSRFLCRDMSESLLLSKSLLICLNAWRLMFVFTKVY